MRFSKMYIFGAPIEWTGLVWYFLYSPRAHAPRGLDKSLISVVSNLNYLLEYFIQLSTFLIEYLNSNTSFRIPKPAERSGCQTMFPGKFPPSSSCQCSACGRLEGELQTKSSCQGSKGT